MGDNLVPFGVVEGCSVFCSRSKYSRSLCLLLVRRKVTELSIGSYRPGFVDEDLLVYFRELEDTTLLIVLNLTSQAQLRTFKQLARGRVLVSSDQHAWFRESHASRNNPKVCRELAASEAVGDLRCWRRRATRSVYAGCHIQAGCDSWQNFQHVTRSDDHLWANSEVRPASTARILRRPQVLALGCDRP